MTLRLRRINLNDRREALLTQRFARNNFLLNYGTRHDIFERAHVDDFVDVYTSWLGVSRPYKDMRFVTISGQPVGHLWMMFRPKSAWVENLFITAAYRGQGVGSKTLRMAENMALRQGYVSVFVGSAASNLDSRRFYEREGWKIIGQSGRRSLRWRKSLATHADKRIA